MDFIIPLKKCMAIGVYGFSLSRIGVLQGVAPLGSVGIFLAWSLTMRLEKFPKELRNFRMV